MADDQSNPIPAYYANTCRVQTSVYDMHLLFARAGPAGFDDQQDVTPLCLISMSPAHALALYKLLKKHLDNYQAKYGVLPDGLAVLQEQQGAQDTNVEDEG